MLAAAPRRLIPEMLYISHSLPELSPRAIVVSATVTKPLVAGRHIPFVNYSGGAETGPTSPVQRGSSQSLKSSVPQRPCPRGHDDADVVRSSALRALPARLQAAKAVK